MKVCNESIFVDFHIRPILIIQCLIPPVINDRPEKVAIKIFEMENSLETLQCLLYSLIKNSSVLTGVFTAEFLVNL